MSASGDLQPNQHVRLSGPDLNHLSWQPGLFAAVLSAVGVCLRCADLSLWSEAAFFIQGGLLGWILAFGPGPAWQRLLVAWLLAVVPCWLVALPLWPAMGFFEPVFLLVRGQAIFLGALVTSTSLLLIDLVCPLAPTWEQPSPMDSRPRQQWSVADWAMLLALVSLSLALAQWLVESAWLENSRFESTTERSPWSFWQLLFRQVGWISLFAGVHSLLILAPLTMACKRRGVTRSGAAWLTRIGGVFAMASSLLFLFLPWRGGLEMVGLIVLATAVDALFLLVTVGRPGSTAKPL